MQLHSFRLHNIRGFREGPGRLSRFRSIPFRGLTLARRTFHLIRNVWRPDNEAFRIIIYHFPYRGNGGYSSSGESCGVHRLSLRGSKLCIARRNSSAFTRPEPAPALRTLTFINCTAQLRRAFASAAWKIFSYRGKRLFAPAPSAGFLF